MKTPALDFSRAGAFFRKSSDYSVVTVQLP